MKHMVVQWPPTFYLSCTNVVVFVCLFVYFLFQISFIVIWVDSLMATHFMCKRMGTVGMDWTVVPLSRILLSLNLFLPSLFCFSSESAPTSFEGNYGRIIYRVRAFITTPRFAKDYNTEKAFYLLRPLNLNELPDIWVRYYPIWSIEPWMFWVQYLFILKKNLHINE